MTYWFYIQEDQQVGPLSVTQVNEAVDSKTIVSDTLMWSDGMADWTPYEQVKDRIQSTGESLEDASRIACPNCHSTVSKDDLVQMGQAQICVMCKDQYVQRIKEGVNPHDLNVRYAGFWLRFCAMFLDGIILRLIQAPFSLLLGLALTQSVSFETLIFVPGFISFPIVIAYYTFFIGHPKLQATPGKMAVGLKVIKSDGGRTTYGHAAVRYLGYILDGLTLGIGYLMCIWDSEKRCLHDRICDTRVIHKS